MKAIALLICLGCGVANALAFPATFEARETELQSFEGHEQVVLDLNKPLYRPGEILMVKASGRWCVAINWHWRTDHWLYDVCPVKVGTRPSNAENNRLRQVRQLADLYWAGDLSVRNQLIEAGQGQTKKQEGN